MIYERYHDFSILLKFLSFPLFFCKITRHHIHVVSEPLVRFILLLGLGSQIHVFLIKKMRLLIKNELIQVEKSSLPGFLFFINDIRRSRQFP